ncbi:hypothetical protein SNEBB_007142 [Seison nebaliae]|nr:hypothetical protein SNEBB_007142 [Seison nebaliae]
MNQQSQMEFINSLEVEMMKDLYERMVSSCREKCIGSSYRNSDLSKGENVCLDRCVAKYLDVHDLVGQKLVASASPNGGVPGQAPDPSTAMGTIKPE